MKCNLKWANAHRYDCYLIRIRQNKENERNSRQLAFVHLRRSQEETFQSFSQVRVVLRVSVTGHVQSLGWLCAKVVPRGEDSSYTEHDYCTFSVYSLTLVRWSSQGTFWVTATPLFPWLLSTWFSELVLEFIANSLNSCTQLFNIFHVSLAAFL